MVEQSLQRLLPGEPKRSGPNRYKDRYPSKLAFRESPHLGYACYDVFSLSAGDFVAWFSSYPFDAVL